VYFKEIVNDHKILKTLSNRKDDTSAEYDRVSVNILNYISENIAFNT